MGADTPFDFWLFRRGANLPGAVGTLMESVWQRTKSEDEDS